MITITISELAARNVLGLITDRLDEIDRLALAHPTLPMKDPRTVQSYTSARDALTRELGMKSDWFSHNERLDRAARG